MAYYNNEIFAKEALEIGKDYHLELNNSSTRKERIGLALKYYDKFLNSAKKNGIKLACDKDPSAQFISFVDFLVKKYSYKKVLDYGCACGKFLEKLSEKNKTIKCFGIDFNIYNNNPEKYELLKYDDNYKIPSNFKFDLIVSHHVIEHIHPQDLQVHLEDVYSHLNIGGAYFISLPSRFCSDFWDTQVIDYFHLGKYSYDNIAVLLQDANFSQIKKVLFNINIIPFMLNPLISPSFPLHERYISKIKSRPLLAFLNLFTIRLVAFKW